MRLSIGPKTRPSVEFCEDLETLQSPQNAGSLNDGEVPQTKLAQLRQKAAAFEEFDEAEKKPRSQRGGSTMRRLRVPATEPTRLVKPWQNH